MKNAENFLKIFKTLEDCLRKQINESTYIPFTKLVEKLSKQNPVINEYKSDLWELAELRNAIVHSPAEVLLADVTDFTVELISKITQQIINPPTAYDIASKPVYCCQLDDSLLIQIKFMKEKTFTHVPVYEGEKFIGVLSESSIFNWLSDAVKRDFFIFDMKVRDLGKYLDIYNRPNEYFEFVKKDENAFLIKQWFTEAIKERKRLGAVFVTEDGTKEGKMLGIITAWDIPRIQSR